METNAEQSQVRSIRGGVRRGRKNDPSQICDLHTRIKRTTHAHLQGIASATGERGISVGELIDRLVEREVRRQERKRQEWCEHTKEGEVIERKAA